MKAKTNAFLATKTGITVEYPKDSQNCPAISTPTRPKRNLEEENKGTTRTMDKQEGIPMVLTSALENIVEQLDVITLVSKFPAASCLPRCIFYADVSLIFFVTSHICFYQINQVSGQENIKISLYGGRCFPELSCFCVPSWMFQVQSWTCSEPWGKLLTLPQRFISRNGMVMFSPFTDLKQLPKIAVYLE